MADQKRREIHWHQGAVTREERHGLLGQRGCTIWLTGLPASGKSTIASALEHALIQRGRHAFRLDGDNVRHGLNRDLGFSARDRAENIRRVAEVSKLFAEAGTIAIASFISPYRADRDFARDIHVSAGIPFFEVYISCPLEVAEGRDPKGLYKKARAGELKGFTGIDDPYEAPERPALKISTDKQSIEQAVSALSEMLRVAGVTGE